MSNLKMGELVIHDEEQGSEAWHALRLQHCTASEAPVMMGDSSKGKRNDLLTLKKTGIAKEVSRFVQERVFDPGHAVEAKQRLLVEEDMGEELYPTTASRIVDGIPLLASTDGQNMMGNVLFEHKQWNEELAAMVRSGELSGEYYWQLEQQLLVFQADHVRFVVSDGTREKREFLDYKAVPGRAAQLLGGWHQFTEDLGSFEAKAPVEKLQARNIENLPALRLELSGSVAVSNLNEYREKALAFIDGIKTDLETEQDFVDAEATVKFCKGAEDKIKEIKAAALNSTADIKLAFDTLDELGESVRKKRLNLEKQVTTQKAERKKNIQVTAENEFLVFMNQLNKEFAPRVRMPEIECDIAGAMHGKRALDSLKEAADTTLAKAKIKATEIATVIRVNLAVLRELDAKYRGLFQDVQEIIQKPADDFANLVELRVKKADDDEAEALRLKKIADQKIIDDALAEDKRKRELAEAEAAKPAPVAEPVAESDPEPVAETQAAATPAPTTSSPAPQRQKPATVTTVSPSPAVTRPVTATLVSLESLILAILDGVAPENLVQVNEEALAAFIAEKGFAPPGFTLSSAS